MGESLLAPLRHPGYRRLWIGQTVSVFGDKVDQIAMAVMVYRLTGSMLQMGVMLAVTTLPAALFGLVAGAYVDRWDRRRTMVGSDLLRAGLVLVIPFAARLNVAAAYVVAFAVSTVSLFFEPAKLASIPELVPSEELMAANSLDGTTSAAAEIVGLLLAGGLVAGVGYVRAFALDAVTYLVSAVFVASIRLPRRSRSTAEHVGGVWADVGEGLRHIRDVPALREAMALYCVAAAGVAASVTLCYALALSHFDAGAVGLALLDIAATGGVLLGSIAVGRSGSARVGRKFIQGMIAFGLLFGSIAMAPRLEVAMALLFLAGIANMWYHVPLITLVQRAAKTALLGRVLSARTAISRVFTVVGFVGAGALAQRVGIPVAVAAVGAIVFGAGLVGLGMPGLREE